MEKEVANIKQSEQILNLFDNMQQINHSDSISAVQTIDFLMEDGKYKYLDAKDVCFYRITQLSYDEDYPRREAFENVLLSLDSTAFNFVYILKGTKSGIELYIGVVKNAKKNDEQLGVKLHATDYGENIKRAFEGNFNGSKLDKIRDKALQKNILSPERYANAGMIMGIPSVAEKAAGQEYDFQGIDRLINSMLGREWKMIVVCEPVPKEEIFALQENLFELYNRLAVCSKQTLQQSVSSGEVFSFGKSTSETTGNNWGYNKGEVNGSSTQEEQRSINTQREETYSEGTHKDKTSGENSGVQINKSASASVTVEIANKHIQDVMEYIDKELLCRLKTGYNKGLFKTSVYYAANAATDATRAKSSIISLLQGEKASYSPLVARSLDLRAEQNGRSSANAHILSTYQNQFITEKNYLSDALLLLGRPFYGDSVGLNTYLTAEEVSLYAGLPQKEVPGITLREGVSFGLNLNFTNALSDDEKIELGHMVQKGRELHNNPFYLSKECMAKHVFVAGVTGSGKTTTCHRLLAEAHTPFLVIEPAKTEYRTLINQYDDLVVYTLGNEQVAPFHINPFELVPGELISAHIDMVKATFTSAFPMEASMPQLLEEAMHKCYEKKGWDIATNTNSLYETPFDKSVDSFPILSNLLQQMKDVVKEKHFGAQMQADYIGSLVSRLSNLTMGAKGSMLNCSHSTDFNDIVDGRVVLELEELKSPEDKALLMGFILSRLSATIKQKHRDDPQFRHLTLVEEAHRLLSKVEYGDSGAKKNAVETFTDLLAEVRKYGEGLIVVDQIPNKLAPEVLKNTNTKIIHKLLARDDKEAVGDTMLMDDKQKEYLSALPVGEAIIFTENTDKPVHVHIDPISDTSAEEATDDMVRERFMQHLSDKLDLIAGSVFPQFKKLCHQIGHGSVDENQFQAVKKRLAETSDAGTEERDALLKKLIARNDLELGEATKCSIPTEERREVLLAYFTELFDANTFSEVGYQHKIYCYL